VASARRFSFCRSAAEPPVPTLRAHAKPVSGDKQAAPGDGGSLGDSLEL
jgi:hypothetical protein